MYTAGSLAHVGQALGRWRTSLRSPGRKLHGLGVGLDAEWGSPGAWERRGQVWKWVGGRGVDGGVPGPEAKDEGRGWKVGRGSRAQGSPEKICPFRLGPGWSLRQREPSSGAGWVSHARPLPRALKAPGPVSPSPTRPRAPRATTQAPQAGGQPWPTRAQPPSPLLCHQLQQEPPPGTGQGLSLSLQGRAPLPPGADENEVQSHFRVSRAQGHGFSALPALETFSAVAFFPGSCSEDEMQGFVCLLLSSLQYNSGQIAEGRCGSQ